MGLLEKFDFLQVVVFLSNAIEAVGVLVIVTGFFIASIVAASRYIGGGRDQLLQRYRRDLGQAMMLGLEFLVAGDIISTVLVSHTINDVLSLGLVVIIRTVLVFTIHLEVEGRWPWQRG